MLVSIFSPKGGSGTSTCTALIAKSFANNEFMIPTFLIDAHNGDLETIIGINGESEYGFAQWVESPSPSLNNLEKISTLIHNNLSLVKYSSQNADLYTSSKDVDLNQDEKKEKIVEALRNSDSICVVDLGNKVNQLNDAIIAASDIVIMVVRGCYITLNRAALHPYSKSTNACVVISEQGRSIHSKQIGDVLNCRCLIEIDARRDFARAIDAGVLIFKTPKNMISPIDAFVSDIFAAQNPYVQSRSTPRKKEQSFDRTQSLPLASLDLFEDSRSKNQQNFWNQEDIAFSNYVEQQEDNSENIEHLNEHRNLKRNPIDVSYTSHLHNAFAGMRSKSSSQVSARARSGRR